MTHKQAAEIGVHMGYPGIEFFGENTAESLILFLGADTA